MSPLRWLLAVASLLVSPLAAQESPKPLRLTGVTFDFWEGEVGPALIRPTIRATHFYNMLGPDFSLTLFPDGILFYPPLVTANLQAGPVLRLPLGPVSFLIEGGGAALMRVGVGGEQLMYIDPGVYYGVGLVLPLEARARVRLDLSRHVYRADAHTRSSWSIGVGIVVARR
jgi:hypothetical protein